MHTGPQYTSTQQQGPSGGGRGTALLVGGISFAVVFLLIVGVTVGYLVLRPNGGTAGGPTTGSASVTDPEASAGSQSPTPTDVEEVRCWSPDSIERFDRHPMYLAVRTPVCRTNRRLFFGCVRQCRNNRWHLRPPPPPTDWFW